MWGMVGFYKIYKTKKEDVAIWNGKSEEDLPNHLQFFCVDDNYKYDEIDTEEIRKYLLPINMILEGTEYHGYLATLYRVAEFGSYAYPVVYEQSGMCSDRFVKLTNSKAKKLLKFGCRLKWEMEFGLENIDRDEYKKGILGKNNQYKEYPGKLRQVVLCHYI